MSHDQTWLGRREDAADLGRPEHEQPVARAAREGGL
jgi:hypothetical protein